MDRRDDLFAPDPSDGGGGSTSIGAVLLGGLTTAEVLAAALAVVAVVAASWALGRTDPSALVTDRWLGATWGLVALAILRPVTWIPYLALFAPIRRLAEAAVPGGRAFVRNAVAHVATVAMLTVIVVAVLAAWPSLGTTIGHTVAFLTGGGSVERFGASTLRWSPQRIVCAAAILVLLRPVVPPLGSDLDVLPDPVFALPAGRRGRFDRVLLIAVAATAGVALIVSVLSLVRSG